MMNRHGLIAAVLALIVSLSMPFAIRADNRVGDADNDGILTMALDAALIQQEIYGTVSPNQISPLAAATADGTLNVRDLLLAGQAAAYGRPNVNGPGNLVTVSSSGNFSTASGDPSSLIFWSAASNLVGTAEWVDGMDVSISVTTVGAQSTLSLVDAELTAGGVATATFTPINTTGVPQFVNVRLVLQVRDSDGSSVVQNVANQVTVLVGPSICGNAVIQPGEVCDDGPGGMCFDDCSGLNACGDGIVFGGEACDDGDTSNCTTGCNAVCTGPGGAACGDGVAECGEACDDGPGGMCFDDCSGLNACGDGIVFGGEACDDGDTSNCTTGCNAVCTGPAVVVCGDGVAECGEACDDGMNGNPCDGCTDSCATTGMLCGNGVLDCAEICDDGPGGVCFDDCSGLNVCGDGIVFGGEACDDGDTSNCTVGCDATCTGPAVPPVCGNFVAECAEACDDGPGGMCFDDCSGLNACGDGIVFGGEFCDDGNTAPCGGPCNEFCTGMYSFLCGNGALECGEACDDANTSDCDGCSANCLVLEAGCGDGSMCAGEACDDGNLTSGDGCDAFCQPECATPFFMEDFETGAPGWTHAALMGGDGWSLSGARASSGVNSYRSGTSIANSDTVLVSPSIALPTGPAALTFRNWYDFDDCNNPSFTGDAGTVEISNDGGFSWNPLTPTGGYPGTYAPPCTFGGTWPAYVHDNGMGGFGWEHFDLAVYAGQTVQVRFRMYFDCGDCTLTDAWFIDDVQVSTCSTCGNGVTEAGESCDDGDTLNCTVGCNATCTGPGAAVCGDGELCGTEVCDDGDTSNCTVGCDATCTGPATVACGDGVAECAEVCDDGPGGVCFDDCSGLNACGDGIVFGGEACDDGDTSNCTVSCDATCTGPAAPPVCGNSVAECAEVCDDGPGGVCFDDCSGLNACGDGIVFGGEACDDGDTSNCTTGCNAVCTGPGGAVCGDGTAECGEQCDDGNLVSGDGCQATCLLPACGDGVTDPAVAPLSVQLEWLTTDCSFIPPNLVLSVNGTDIITQPLEIPSTCSCGPKAIGSALEVNPTAMALFVDGSNSLRLRLDMGGVGGLLAWAILTVTTPTGPQVFLLYDGGNAPLALARDPEPCNFVLVDTYDSTQNHTVSLYTEACDDGDTSNCTTGCNAACTGPGGAVCGDGELCGTEVCDDGDASSCTTGCNATCTGPAVVVCGDGVAECGEVCDDGPGGMCFDDCSGLNACGDGIIFGGEVCDDGDASNCTTGCNAVCTGPAVVVCGDGVAECGEACDDGVLNGQPNQCDATCTGITPPVCGNFVAEAGEVCDDGMNGNPCDGCTDGCATTASLCGNGVLDCAEICDDGNALAGDGCDPTCIPGCVNTALFEDDFTDGDDAGWAHSAFSGPDLWHVSPNGNAPGGTLPPNTLWFVDEIAGHYDFGLMQARLDGPTVVLPALQPGESLSFGYWEEYNTEGGGWDLCIGGIVDGVPADNPLRVVNGFSGGWVQNSLDISVFSGQSIRPYFYFNTQDSFANNYPGWKVDEVQIVHCRMCSNGYVDPGETCDDGNLAPGDGCDGLCQLESVCGNGLVEGVEVCDDGPGGVCFDDCSGLNVCGDGIVFGGEACDDGDTSNCTTGCNAVCTGPAVVVCGDGVAECGEVCDDGPGGVCFDDCSGLNVCGDGIPFGTELCDLGAGNSDQLANTCRTTCVNPFCGDGVVDNGFGEGCDDGNVNPGDGCTPFCQPECNGLVFADNFETGGPGWTHYPEGNGPDRWQLSANPARASSGVFSYWSDMSFMAPNSDNMLESPVIVLPLGPINLSFRHWYQADSCGTPNEDSAVVEIAVGGGGGPGAPWAPIFPVTGYPDFTEPMCINNFFRPPYVGSSYEGNNGLGTPDWVGFDLTPYAGMPIRIRFRYMNDCSLCAPAEGWYLDDVRVATCP